MLPKLESTLSNWRIPFEVGDITWENVDLEKVLASRNWLNSNIPSILTEHPSQNVIEELDFAYSSKYGLMSFEDDARFVAPTWQDEFIQALSYLSIGSNSKTLLHIGSDSFLEPQSVHSKFEKVILTDVSQTLLKKALNESPNSTWVQTSAEKLDGIPNNSIDFYLALRVYDSHGLNIKKSIIKAKNVLNENGSFLISISNGYRAIDDTILPGQIIGTPARICLNTPFERVNYVLNLLVEQGFSQVFVFLGSTEIYCGAKVKIDKEFSIEKIDISSLNSIPVQFYSELMPTSWLGNFSNHSIEIDGASFQTVEHYFQSQKFKDPTVIDRIRNLPRPIDAKKFAWEMDFCKRDDWSEVKQLVMIKGVYAKFTQHPQIQEGLRSLKGRRIVELSKEDHVWGKNLLGKGLNLMGKILKSVQLKI